MNMREKIARAIALADERNGGPPYEYRITLSKHAKEHLFDQADAVLDALMKPTEGMKDEGAYGPTTLSYGDEDSFYYVSGDDAEEIFSSMIKAAKEGK